MRLLLRLNSLLRNQNVQALKLQPLGRLFKVGGAAALMSWFAFSYAQSSPSTLPSASLNAAMQPTPSPKKPESEIRPTAVWTQLSIAQKKALSPLQSVWNSLPAGQQLKWIALAEQFQKMAPSDQQKLQSRMQEWAALGTFEREQARYGFSETRKLSAEKKKESWAAYQALSDEQKAQLAKQNGLKKGVAAQPVQPVPTDKKVNMPASAATTNSPSSAPIQK